MDNLCEGYIYAGPEYADHSGNDEQEIYCI